MSRARKAIIQKVDAKRRTTRKPDYYDPPIILGLRGGISRSEIKQIEERLRKKVGRKEGKEIEYIKSTDNILMKKGLSATSTDLATRLLTKYFMRPFTLKNKLAPNQKKALEALLRQRDRKIKGTNIQLSPNHALLLLTFANSLGENGYKKASELTKQLDARGKALKNITKKTKTKSDMFHNVYPRINAIGQFYGIGIEVFLKEVQETIAKRRQELEQLKTMNIPQKEKYVAQIEQELNQTKKNYILFRQKNFN